MATTQSYPTIEADQVNYNTITASLRKRSKKPVIITKGNKPQYVIYKLKQTGKITHEKKASRDRLWQIIDQIREHAKNLDPDEVYRIVTEETEIVRAQRYEQKIKSRP